MRNLHFSCLFIAITATVLLSSSSLNAVVIRADREDVVALKLASEFDLVGRILPDGSCTLIAPTWAITAAHVARRVKLRDHIEFRGTKYSVKRVLIHPEGVGPANTPPEVDLALIELAEPVMNVKPAKLYTEKRELNQTVFIVGYGDYGTALSKLTPSDGKRRAVTNTIDDAGPRRIFMKFDEPPKGTECEGVGGPGDSGGPALLKIQDDIYIAGVSSASMDGKPGAYNVTDVYVRISSYRRWIEDTMRKH